MTETGFRIEQGDTRPYVLVPWADADELQSKLKARGLHVAVVYKTDILEPEARIEPWPGVDPNAVLYALNEMASR